MSPDFSLNNNLLLTLCYINTMGDPFKSPRKELMSVQPIIMLPPTWYYISPTDRLNNAQNVHTCVQILFKQKNCQVHLRKLNANQFHSANFMQSPRAPLSSRVSTAQHFFSPSLPSRSPFQAKNRGQESSPTSIGEQQPTTTRSSELPVLPM